MIRRLAVLALLVAFVAPSMAGEAVQPLPVVEVAPGVFVHEGVRAQATPENEGAIANVGFIVGEKAVAVIDSGGSPREGQELLAAIRKVTALPVAYVVNTHMHPDHILGNAVFAAEGATVVGHTHMPEALAAREAQYLEANKRYLGPALSQDLKFVAPILLVEGKLELDLGNRPILLQAWPTAHTDNDLTVFDEKTATLFAGDLVFQKHLPVIDGKILGWFKVMDELATVKAVRAVPGHGPASIPWPDGMADQRRYLETLARDLREIIKRGGDLNEAVKTAGQSERDRWELFDDYNPRNATAGFAELEWE
ncbi:MAG: quinoprotein relay system zinc metallohydrolase 2 [Hyphomicrobiales bacterium]